MCGCGLADAPNEGIGAAYWGAEGHDGMDAKEIG